MKMHIRRILPIIGVIFLAIIALLNLLLEQRVIVGSVSIGLFILITCLYFVTKEKE
ncbi:MULTISPECIES: hypothetical protein [Bacillus]|jgi:hypothetical protein|uniref:Uncharacterized protein n=1 Tax=Bacillus altitudinis TaxID=293387 RepID=A0A1K2A741_BACAB|nr:MULTISPECIES: hypothetical protein [Bacillus]MBR0577685.1 hypothetical protein [Bacillus altitudinis A23-8]MBU8693341.1 hypothetical protein [Bacillus altitudinis]MCI9883047.1 hypothetical protein [Bacillus altitudinis]MCS3483939.1 hypothetical protein [Bacillus sp. JUb11]MCY7450467.1 hypothetical protein [Bacillus altitudinis]